MSIRNSSNRVLRLAVFDLDYTVWEPEMYQLWGAPRLAPISTLGQDGGHDLGAARTNKKDMVLMDKSKSLITVFRGAAHALMEINRLKEEGHDIQAAVASRTDEPHWAHICMKHLTLEDGTTLVECFEDRIEIDCYNDKTHHIKRLHKQTGVPFEQMCFFDNEEWNIQCVARLGVHCIYTPDGMTRQAWKDALARFKMADW